MGGVYKKLRDAARIMAATVNNIDGTVDIAGLCTRAAGRVTLANSGPHIVLTCLAAD
jgi:hypothetical protein